MIGLRPMKRTLRIVGSYALAILPPAGTYLLLGADSGIWALILYSAVTTTLFLLNTRATGGWRVLLRTLIALLGLSGAVVITVSLNLTPASAYLAWFHLVQQGASSGVLSFMFSVKVCFFSSLFAGLVPRRGFLAPFFGFSGMYLLILYVVFQLALLAYGAIASLILAVGFRVLTSCTAHRVRAVLVAALVVGVASLLAWPLSRSEARELNVLVDSLSYQDLSKAVIAVYPDFPFLYNMPGYGHQLGERKIGGRPALTARPVFEVSGRPGETVYLRTAVYGFFTGAGWAQNETRLNAAADGYQALFSAGDEGRLKDPLRVRILIDFFSSIPHTLDSRRFILSGVQSPPFLTHGSLDTGFVFEIPAVTGTEILIERWAADPEHPGELSEYLQLPEGIPARVREIAALLRVEDEPLTTAANIRDFLAANYYYTLEPDSSRRGEDPVWSFFDGGSGGYCVHFATAFNILARLAGLPSRYVTGFLVNIPTSSDTAEVNGYSSHAWAELWTPESGWVVQEATPPMLPEYFDDPYYYEMYNPLGSRYTARQLEAIMGNRVGRPPTIETTRTSTNPLPFILLPLGLALTYLVYRFFSRSLFAPRSPGRNLRVIGRRLIQGSSKLGFATPEVAGWLGWAGDAGRHYPDSRKLLERAALILLSRLFGGQAPTKRDVVFLRGVYLRVFG